MRFRRKLIVLYLTFFVGLVIIELRVVQLQVFQSERWEAAARKKREQRQPLPAMRGSVRARGGELLAHDERVPQLAVVPAEWVRRHRVRCTRCGIVHHYKRTPPKRCACWRHGAGVEVASLGEQAGPPRLEPVPPASLDALEDAVGLERGDLAREAQKRIRTIEQMVKTAREQDLAAGMDEFLADDNAKIWRADLMARPFVVVARFPEGGRRTAMRLVELDEVGAYRGFRMVTALRRKYPFGDFAAQLLGYTSMVRDRKELEALEEAFPGKITGRTQVGRAGLEKAYQGHLSGTPGERYVARDEHGAFTKLVSEQPPVPGETLHLSVDYALSVYAQSIIEKYGAQPVDDEEGYTVPGYAPRGRPSGAFVMIDALSGDVLIWADMPRFDLDADRGVVLDKLLASAVPDPVTGLWRPGPGMTLPEDFDPVLFDASVVKPAGLAFSRVSQVAVEPGSTFKPLIALALLHSGVGALSGFQCGRMVLPGCHRHASNVNVESAISISCNQFFATWLRRVGSWSGKRHFVPSFLYQFGLGQRPADSFVEWSAGQLLRDWIDTPPLLPARQAAETVSERQGRKLSVTVRPGGTLPPVICGEMDTLRSIFRRCFEQIVQETGIRDIGVSAREVALDQRTVDIEYEISARGKAGWHRHGLDYSQLSYRGWPKRLQRAASQVSAIGGLSAKFRPNGDLGNGGRIVFRLRFDRASGRTSAEKPVVLRKDDAYNVAIGQGPVLATPLQMARAMAALANGGKLVTPGVVSRIGDEAALRPKPRALGLDPHHLGRVRVGMQDVVTTGTARRSGLARLPMQVFGKTGTAQVGKSWMPFDRNRDRTDDTVWHHWFVGWAEAPGRRPVAFACVLHARREGAAGSTSAKAVAEILEAWGRQ